MKAPMKRIVLVPLILITTTITGCSYITNLVVVNLSDKAIEVTYQIKLFPGPFHPPLTPAIKPTNELDDDTLWSELSPDQYKLYPESRSVTVTLMPNTAVRVGQVQGPGMPEGAEAAASFEIEEIVIVGAYGEMKFQGEQVRKSFKPESKKLYSITYR